MGIARLLGYMTAREAVSKGYTHHGKYFGIPLWIADDGPDGCVTAAKWAPLDYLMIVFSHIEMTLAPMLRPDSPPAFMFLVGPEILKDGDDD